MSAPDEKIAAMAAMTAAIQAVAANKQEAKAKPERRWSKGKGWDKKSKSEEKEEPEFEGDLFENLSPLLDGEIRQEYPTVGVVGPNGEALLYRRAISEGHGEPGCGKSNVASCVEIAEIKSNPAAVVLVIDPEDTKEGFMKTLRSLSCDDPAVHQAVKDGRIKYVHNPDMPKLMAAQRWAIENKPTLVVLDGLAELLSADGKNEDSSMDILAFFRQRVRPFAEKAGAAVYVNDHTGKITTNEGWSRGSSAKKGRYDGASYLIKIGQAYSPKIAGYLKLILCKDRKGGVGPKDSHVFNLRFSPAPASGLNHTEATWEVVAARSASGEGRVISNRRPETVMAEILRKIQRDGYVNKTTARTCGNHAQVDRALEILKDDGMVDWVIVGGNKEQRYTLTDKAVKDLEKAKAFAVAEPDYEERERRARVASERREAA